MNWKSIKDSSPPFDVLCLVRGTDDHGVPVYALAFNQCYPPYCSMLQKIDFEEEIHYAEMHFEIEAWCKVTDVGE